MNANFSTVLKNTYLRSVPLLMGSLLATLMSFMDGIFLVHWNKTAFNALIMAIPVVSLVSAFYTGLGAAFSDDFVKAKNENEKLKAVLVSAGIGMLLNVLLTIAAFFLVDYFLRFNAISADHPENHQLGTNIKDYWFWIIPSYWAQPAVNLMVQFLTIKKKLIKANILLLIICLVNLALNPVFIFYFNWGVKGAALATTIALFSGVFWFIFNHLSIISLFLQNTWSWFAKHNLLVLKQNFFNQWINVLSFFLAIGVFSIGQLIFNKLAINIGTKALIFFGITEQIKMLVTIPTRGVIGAYLIEFGDQLKEKATQLYFCTYWAATLIIGLIYLLGCTMVLIFPDAILAFFNVQAVPEKEELIKMLEGLIGVFLLGILPRASQVAFISLEKGYLLFLQSLIMIVSSLLFASVLIEQTGSYGLVKGQVWGMVVTLLLFFPLFILLLFKKIKNDKRAPLFN